MDSRFWTYVHATTYSVRLTQRSIKQTSGIQNLDQASYFNEVAPFPPPKTQAQIADFLDRETAQIDDLIGKQERLIELLAEKRQAVITQAVTKGLDPESPTKPSRIPWLGDVNAEWPIRPLKAVGEINLGKMIQPMPKATGDVQAPYLRAANVQPGGVLTIDDVKEMWFTKRELSSLDVLAGDVVVVEGGIGGFGRAAFVDNDLAGFGYQNSINRIRPNQDVDGRFLTYLLLTARQSGFIHAYCTGVSMPHLTAEKLAVIQVPFPDYATQTAIGDFLDQRLKSFAQLSSKASNVISILQERRSALISAAVTGKINVLSKEL
nr:restriction endonuclease subunit S [Arthrobacter stackebrandtii]